MADSEINSPFELLVSIERRVREQAAPLPEEQPQAGNWKGVAFRLKKWPLVASQGEVQEVLTPPKITRVPGTHPWVSGIGNIHGKPLPIVDLVNFFWGEPLSAGQSSRVLLVCQEERECGILVSEVEGVLHFSSRDNHAEPYPFPARLNDYLVGCSQYQGVLRGEFSMQRLLESPEIMDLSAN